MRVSRVAGLPALIGVSQSASRLLFWGTTRSPASARWDLGLVWVVPLSLVTYLAADGVALLAVFVVLYGAGNGIVTILRGLLVPDHVSEVDVGALNGLIALPAALGRAAGPWLLALAWQIGDGYREGVALLLLLASASAVALAMTHRKRTH